MTRTDTMVVGEIVNDGDRRLIYGPEPKEPRRSDVLLGRYHVIATELQAAGLRPGDTVTYEPYGVNFGWFIAADR